MNSALKFLLDLGPLVIFFASYYALGIMPATAIFMVATVAAGVVTYVLTKKISVLIVFSAVVVLIFGGLTIWLNDELFIKLKPTIYYFAVSFILAGALATGRLVIKELMDLAIQLTDKGWEIFTIRLTLFFLFLAGLNIYVAQTYSFDTWLWLKVWGFIPLNLLFFIAQVPLFMKHEIKPEDGEPAAKS
jgi:intracellular septation protein